MMIQIKILGRQCRNKTHTNSMNYRLQNKFYQKAASTTFSSLFDRSLVLNVAIKGEI